MASCIISVPSRTVQQTSRPEIDVAGPPASATRPRIVVRFLVRAGLSGRQGRIVLVFSSTNTWPSFSGLVKGAARI